MKKVTYLISLLMILTLSSAYAQLSRTEQLKKEFGNQVLSNSSAQGYEFMICFPPNETYTYEKRDTDNLIVYVSSTKPTDVSLYFGKTNALIRRKRIDKPFGIVTFDIKAGDFDMARDEVRTYERISNQSFKIVASSNPVSVYMLNSKYTTSDGCMAIPISAWGTEYIHCGYYDKNEGSQDLGDVHYFGSGFIVVSSQDGTAVEIDIKGKGSLYSSTTSGKKYGDKIKVTLNRGQIYQVRGSAIVSGIFDLTGTKITANKPIGLFSYHQRTDLPALIASSRDYLIEMIPPVHAWGNFYATVELNRRRSYGDLFRIVAAEDNTDYQIFWYNKDTFQQLGTKSGKIQLAGDFVDLPEGLKGGGTAVRGVSVFKSNKPILVMHYSFSAGWDNDTRYDPFMVVTTSKEQFTNATIFQTPDDEFDNNWFNIIAVGNPSNQDSNSKLLESITLDDEYIYQLVPSFKNNRIPGTDLYWARLQVEPGPHYLKGDTKFGAYIYGFTNVDSYGWPAAMAINKIDQTDTLEPQLYLTGECGEYSIRFTEKRNGKDYDDPMQIDQGVVEKPKLLDPSFNFTEPIFSNPYAYYPPTYDNSFNINVIDKSQDAMALVAVIDRAGNMALEKIEYFADKFQATPQNISFSEVRVGTSKIIEFELKNIGSATIDISSLELLLGQHFKITNLDELPQSLSKDSTIIVKIEYSPTRESKDKYDLDVDSLIISTKCHRFAYQIDGRGVIPKIDVSDWDAGSVFVGDEKCMENGIKISNVGSETITINGYSWELQSNSFEIRQPISPNFPITIAPSEYVYLKTVCFKPLVPSLFNDKIVFETNAVEGKSYSILRGSSIQTEPVITDFNWHYKRVLDETEIGYDGYVILSNNGTAPLSFLKAEIDEANDGSYEIISYQPTFNDSIDIYPSDDQDPSHNKSVRINLRFKPIKENVATSVKIYPIFSDSLQNPRGSVYGILEGSSYLPKIQAMGYDFAGETELGQTTGGGKVVIRSTSNTADLFIKEIKIIPTISGSENDFIFSSPMPNNIILKKGTELELPVSFAPKSINKREIRLDIYNDAFPAYDSIRVSSVVVSGFAYSQSFEASNVNMPTITRCDESVSDFSISNTGLFYPLEVKSIKVENEFSDVLSIMGFAGSDSIAPQQSKIYQIKFSPVNRTGEVKNNNSKIKAKVYVETSIGTKSFDVEVMSVLSQVRVAMPEINEMVAGMTTSSEYKEFPVSIRLDRDASHNGNWSDVNISEFEMEINYNPRWMKYNDTIFKSSMLSDWTFTGKEIIHNEKSATLLIQGKGGSIINKNGDLFNPKFLMLLSDSASFSPTFGKVTFFNRDDCVEKILVPGRIHLQHCVQNLRDIIINKNNFGLIPISPNPVSGGALDINFSIGLDNVYTKIDIINSTGEIVRVLQDGEMRQGKYSAKLITDELSSGVYFINMQSGPFMAREKVIITK